MRRRIEIGNLISLRHLFRSRAVVNLIFYEKLDFPACATGFELPSNISIMPFVARSFINVSNLKLKLKLKLEKK